MPVDTSIYQTLQPLASPVDLARNNLQLSQMHLQNQQLQQQTAMRGAMMQAYAQNTDPQTGQLNRDAFLSSLGRMNPMAAQEARVQFAGQDKAIADANSAKAEAASRALNVSGPALDYLQSLPEDARSQSYSGVLQQLKSQGIDVSDIDHPYDPQLFARYYGIWQKSKPALENYLTQANIGKAQAETARDYAEAGAPAPLKIGAEELGKFNEDVNNASSRKTTGSLIDARTRADRILSILNSGAKPGETQAQRITRLNQYMPQIGTEIGTSLAAIMQGGVPNEDLQKKLSPDTISSNLATLEQRWKASPTAANQGALLDAYGDVASKLRDFSAGQLGQITQRARAAYPYANKYYGKEMDQISAPLLSPGSGASSLAKGQGQGGGGGLIPSANAGQKAAPSARDANALQWLKTADPSSPKAFQIRAILKAKGLL